MSRDEWIKLPPVSWIVPGLIRNGGLHVLWGDTSIGKTHVAISLAAHIALGLDWHGKPVFRCPVYFCALEGREGVVQRLRATEAHLGLPLGNLRLLSESFDLSSVSYVDRLYEASRAGERGIFIIDPLTLAKGDMDVSSGSDVESLFRTLAMLQSLGYTVLLLHHSGHNKSHEMGSKSLRNLADVTLKLEAPRGQMVLTVVKSRDGEAGERLTGRTSLIDVEGQTVPVYVPDDSVPTGCRQPVDRLSPVGRLGTSGRAVNPETLQAVRVLRQIDRSEQGVSSHQWQQAWMAETGKGETTFTRRRDEAVWHGLVRREGEAQKARYFPVSEVKDST